MTSDELAQMSDIELKALAFDQVLMVQQMQASVNAIHQELARRAHTADEPAASDVKKARGSNGKRA